MLLIKREFQKETKVESKATIIGHPQRGGVPVADDRVLAATMGAFAVERLIAGETGVAVNIVNNTLSTKDILEVVKMPRPSREVLLNQYDLLK